MTQPFFGRGQQPQFAPGRRTQPPNRRACQHHSIGQRGNLPRQHAQQFILPVARNPANAQDLALAHGQMHVLQ